MSQLIRMRQRIKAIKTIKKITHALRLISMSTHLRLRAKKNSLELYKATIAHLFNQVHTSLPQWHHLLMHEHKSTNPPLIILVGSQKGLCGNFNTELFAFYEHETPLAIKQHASFITIGKKAHDYAKLLEGSLVRSFDEFSMATIEKICTTLTDYIFQNAHNYSSITVYSSYSKSFFHQKPHTTQIIPFKTESLPEDSEMHDYIWEQQPEDILNFLIEKLLYTTLYELLFQSLIAEQAARFIAMDNSTRSAGKLLDAMKLQYNKMRQSKITSELTDLIGGFF